MLAAGEAALASLDGMARNRYRIPVGPDAKMMDAIYRLHPRRGAAFLAGQMKGLLARWPIAR